MSLISYMQEVRRREDVVNEEIVAILSFSLQNFALIRVLSYRNHSLDGL